MTRKRNRACEKKYYEDHGEKIRVRSKKHYEDHKEEYQVKAIKYYEDHGEKIRVRSKKHYEDHKEECKAYKKRQTVILKTTVLNEYGALCECCGEDTYEFLTIDHTHGLQGKRRITGSAFYIWLKKHNYPKDNFRCLCMNCNFAKGKYGYCPHQKEA